MKKPTETPTNYQRLFDASELVSSTYARHTRGQDREGESLPEKAIQHVTDARASLWAALHELDKVRKANT